MQFAKGYLGARWLASDPNGDSMIYTVEIRGVNETEWKPLRAKLTDKYISWDTTAFPDGDYRLRVTASDAPSNPPARGARRAPGKRALHHRQHASPNHRPHGHAQRRKAGRPLARRRRAQ